MIASSSRVEAGTFEPRQFVGTPVNKTRRKADKMDARPFSLKIFVADGDPDGLRVVERSNWIGKALVFPRTLLPTIKHREEFSQTGVYLLLGPRPEGDGEMLYVGEGDPVRPRIESHFAQKDFWTHAVFFVAGHGQLNKAHVQFLESQLIKRAKAARRVPLDNGNSPTEPSLSEADVADMHVFLENILGILPVLGVSAFERSTASVNARASSKLTCRGKGITAHGYESTQGFVVEAGSQAVAAEVPSMKEYVPGMYELRRQLIENSVLARNGTDYAFSQDYTFTSPSTAAAVVLGRSANGRTEWRDESGTTLKEIQQKQAANVV